MKRAAIVWGGTLVLALVCAFGSPASPRGEDPQAGARAPSFGAATARIGEIVILVDGAPAGPDIGNLITVAAGDPLSERRIDAVLKQIHQTGLFSDVRVLWSGEPAVRLTFLLARRVLTRRIDIAGDRTVSRTTLRNGLYALRPDGPFSDDRMLRAADELKELLRKEGYSEASVTARMVRDPARPAVDVTFEIDAGRRFEISSLEIIGGADLPQATLRRILESRTGRPYVPNAVEADRARIKDLYAGTAKPGDNLWNAANFGIGYAPFHEFESSLYTPELKAALQSAIFAMEAGTLKTCPDNCGKLE